MYGHHLELGSFTYLKYLSLNLKTILILKFDIKPSLLSPKALNILPFSIYSLSLVYKKMI